MYCLARNWPTSLPRPLAMSSSFPKKKVTVTKKLFSYWLDHFSGELPIVEHDQGEKRNSEKKKYRGQARK